MRGGEKPTLKSKVLDFVENMGSARYVDILKFVVDTKFGEGKYDSGFRRENMSFYNKRKTEMETKNRRVNIWRGYFSSAFCGPSAYFMKGMDHLEKQEDGRYVTVRNRPSTYVWTPSPFYGRYRHRYRHDFVVREYTPEERKAEPSKDTTLSSSEPEKIIVDQSCGRYVPNRTPEFDENATLFVLAHDVAEDRIREKLNDWPTAPIEEDGSKSLFMLVYYAPNGYGPLTTEVKHFTDAEVAAWCADKNMKSIERL